jgi:hypothetical protein
LSIVLALLTKTGMNAVSITPTSGIAFPERAAGRRHGTNRPRPLSTDFQSGWPRPPSGAELGNR